MVVDAQSCQFVQRWVSLNDMLKAHENRGLRAPRRGGDPIRVIGSALKAAGARRTRVVDDLRSLPAVSRFAGRWISGPSPPPSALPCSTWEAFAGGSRGPPRKRCAGR
jgi:hypothetical protein